MNKINLWIDTDMGNDDIMAIAMLLQDPKISIKTISLVNGVSTVKKGLVNIQSILEFLGVKIDLFQDFQISKYPYALQFPKQDINRAEELTLLKNLSIKKVQSTKSQDINQLFEKLPDGSTLLALGPLTNVAKLIKTQPEIFRRKITQIVLMGGGINKGNVPPLRVAEYNIALDPKAADVVFNSGVPIVMIGIDATGLVPCTDRYKEQSRKLAPKGLAASVLREMVINNEGDFDQFYDPLAAAFLIEPTISLIALTQGINVMTEGDEIGRTVLKKDGVVKIPTKINSKAFYSLLTGLMRGESEI